MNKLNSTSLNHLTRTLAAADLDLGRVFNAYGPPPLWEREPGFATLIHIILEQQVSLASAKACIDKLTARVEIISPEAVLSLNDAELRAVGFSHQKTAYARHLSEAILERRIDLEKLDRLPDADIKFELMKLNGIGEWTSDIYLLMAMLRQDVMPKGDLALHTAWHKLSGKPRPSSEEFVLVAAKWAPYRSVAARLLWHFYLSELRKPAL
ncbi:MAG: hypothetical protein WBD22_03795 [Pyrinomonadaceae bacterium]